MARPTQRWIFLLSVCLLLQQFAPAYTAHVKKKKKKPTSHQDDYNNNTDPSEGTGEKRFIAAAKFIGSNLLKGITYSANAVTFGSTVVHAIAGCSASQPGLEADWQNFQDMKQTYDDIGNQIRDLSRQAEERQLYSNDTFYNYRDTRDRVRALSDEQTLVLKSIGPEVLIVINNVSFALERIFEEANKTDQEVDVLDVDKKFAEGLDLGLRLTFASATLAIPGMKKLWNSYLKDTTIGKRITGFIDRFKTKVSAPVASGKASLTKLLSKGILGRVQSKITAKLTKIINKVAPKFAKAKNLFKLAKSGVTGLVKLGGAALAIWAAFETFKTCQDKADQAKESLAKMQEALDKIKGHLDEVKEANQDVQEAWKEVYKTSMEENLLLTLQDMREMMLEDYFSTETNEDEKNEVAGRIQDYIDVKDLNPDDESTKATLNARMRAMNELLGTITVTLSCFRHKGNAFDTIRLECARGDSPFPFIYDDIVNKVPIDTAKKCLQRTGEEYITQDRMKDAWNKWVESNDTDISEVCLLNNNILVERAKDFLRQKNDNAEEIAREILRADKVDKGGVDEVQAVIDKIKKEFPNIENELTEADKTTICNLKKSFPDPQKLLSIASVALGKPDLTIEMINSVQCD